MTTFEARRTRPDSNSKSKPGRDFLYLFTLLMISSAVFGLYMLLATRNNFYQLQPMIDGTAPRPFVYRVLTPILVRILSDVFNTPPFINAIVIMYLSMLGFACSILALSREFLPTRYLRPLVLLAPVGLIPLLFWQRHIYDLPTLFLFTLALYWLAKAKFGQYLLTLGLATLSKETSLLLIVFFAIQFRKLERTRFLLLCFLQVAIYILVRLVLIVIFRNSPGGLFEFHLFDHIDAYLQYPVNTIIFFITIFSIMAMSAIHTLDRSNFVSSSLAAIGVPMLFLYFLFGMPFELRVFLEVYPSIFLTVTLAVLPLTDRRPSPRPLV